jgi:hypothetical protein
MKTRHGVGVVALISIACGARADIVYQNENLPPLSAHEFFNNSQGTETEDSWVANAFQVVAGGTHITSFTFLVGETSAGANIPSLALTYCLYTGTSLTSPAGLSRIAGSTNSTTLTNPAVNTFVTLNLATPIDLPVGQVFYAAMLAPGTPGNIFPFSSDFGQTGGPPPLGRSFFDVGPTQGAPYNLDVTTNATVLGGSHPVVTQAQDPGNLALRVNAVPAPSSLGLLGLGGLIAARRRRS